MQMYGTEKQQAGFVYKLLNMSTSTLINVYHTHEQGAENIYTYGNNYFN